MEKYLHKSYFILLNFQGTKFKKNMLDNILPNEAQMF